MSGAEEPARAQKIQSIVDWMIDGARTVRLPQDILGELCQRLTAAGLPLHRAALAVAAEAATNLVDRNADLAGRRGPVLRHALAFHIGEVLYGNIGGAGRLDFTAIGRSVNRTARLQTLAAELGREVVASAAFAEHCGDALAPLGQFSLKGFGELQDVYGLARH